MINRPQLSSRSTSLNVSMLVVLGCVAASLAMSATSAKAAESCSNEQRRHESNVDPASGQPYSLALPECRAYEMVSPLYKQSHRAEGLGGVGIPIAPSGGAAGFASQGDFAEPENSVVSQSPINVFVSRRGESGWTTSSAVAPARLVNTPFVIGFNSNLSADLGSAEVGCGFDTVPRGAIPRETNGVVCARKLGNSEWMATPVYTTLQGENPVTNVDQYLGGSGSPDELSRSFVQVAGHLLPSDTLPVGGAPTGIYEIAGVGTSSPELRLVNVDNKGASLGFYLPGGQLGTRVGPVFGDYQQELIEVAVGSTYHASSESGGTVFFTAMPTATQHEGEEQPGEEQTVYARIPCNSEAASCAYVGREGHKVAGTGRETVAVSNPSPSECIPKCLKPGARPATYRSASADGSKVFFTTAQELLPGDEDELMNLYEYDFNEPVGKNLIQISAGSAADGDPSPGTGTAVAGVLRASSDGSHIYFVAAGAVLTEVANGNGEKAEAGGKSLYGYDTVTHEVKFVATTEEIPQEGNVEGHVQTVPAQTTPDGRYLVFSSAAQLAGDTNTGAHAVYRYDFQTGELTWVSQAAPGFTARNEGRDAIVPFLPTRLAGGEADINDFNRAVSGCPNEGERSKTEELDFECPRGKYDGEYVVFTTAEQLQANDINRGSDVYEWHCASPCPHPATEGTVSMISDGSSPEGTNPEGTTPGGMSASGSDIFFFTQTRLAGQDTDELVDLYDARVGGGFPAPAMEPPCSGDACQPPSKSPPTFGAAASSLFPAGGNLGPPRAETLAFHTSTPKPLTLAQKLTKALKACRTKRNKNQRATCERQARKRYAGKAIAKKKAKAIKSDRRGA